MKSQEIEQEIKDIEDTIAEKEENIETLSKEACIQRWETREIIAKDKLGDLYSTDRDEMIEWRDVIVAHVKTLTDNERLVVSRFLHHKNVISFCRGFGTYNCNDCYIVEPNKEELLEVLDLEKFTKYRYRKRSIPDEVVDQAQTDLVGKSDLEERLDNERSEIESLAEEKKSKWKLHNIYEVLEKNEIDPNEVLQSMPSFIPFAVINRRRRTRIIYATVNQGENVGVILTDESTNKGYGGLEWGINVIAFRDGESESEYYKYRATSGRRDLRNCFVEADIQNVTDEGFEVELKSAKPEFGARRIITKHYDLKKQEEQLILEDRLNPEEQKQFTDSLERIKEKLIDSHHRKGGEMPAYASFLNFGQSRRNNPVVIPQGLDQVRIPYELPEIVDEFVAEGQGEAVLVVKAQIDFNPGGGRQFEWVAYKVTQDGKEMIDRNCAYQESLAEGQVVDIKASLLYKKHFDLNRD